MVSLRAISKGRFNDLAVALHHAHNAHFTRPVVGKGETQRVIGRLVERLAVALPGIGVAGFQIKESGSNNSIRPALLDQVIHSGIDLGIERVNVMRQLVPCPEFVLRIERLHTVDDIPDPVDLRKGRAIVQRIGQRPALDVLQNPCLAGLGAAAGCAVDAHLGGKVFVRKRV